MYTNSDQLNQKRSDLSLRIEKDALQTNVPIMERESLEALLQMLTIQRAESILEIGTAIGYSSIRMIELNHKVQVVSIERDEERYARALQNRLQLAPDVATRLTLLKGDAFDLKKEVVEHGPFDALFIDAAKSQNENFIDIYQDSLKDDSVIYIDNVLFKGLVYSEKEPETRNVRQLVNKIKRFNEKMLADETYKVTILPLGDGLMIATKRRA